MADPIYSDFYLPKPLMMLTASYLTHYDLSKLSQSSSYFHACAQARFRQLYTLGIEESPADSENPHNWMVSYAKLVSRRTFALSSGHKLNPHEPETTKDLIAHQLPTVLGRRVHSVYQGGKLNACLASEGELLVTASQDFDQVLNVTQQQYAELKQAIFEPEGVESLVVAE